jgi:hypothetical protein
MRRLSLTAGDAERPGLLGYIKGVRFIWIEAFDTDVAVTATELLRFGRAWAAVYAIHAARPSAAHLSGRYLLILTPQVTGRPCKGSAERVGCGKQSGREAGAGRYGRRTRWTGIPAVLACSSRGSTSLVRVTKDRHRSERRATSCWSRTAVAWS